MLLDLDSRGDSLRCLFNFLRLQGNSLIFLFILLNSKEHTPRLFLQVLVLLWAFGVLRGCSGVLRGCSGLLWAAPERYAPRVSAALAPAAAGATAPFNFPRISKTIPFQFPSDFKGVPFSALGNTLRFQRESSSTSNARDPPGKMDDRRN